MKWLKNLWRRIRGPSRAEMYAAGLAYALDTVKQGQPAITMLERNLDIERAFGSLDDFDRGCVAGLKAYYWSKT